jgi:membrane dipeptidase
VATHESPDEALPRVEKWRDWIKRNEGIFHVASTTDLKQLGDKRLGITFHFQNATPLGDRLGLVEEYRQLGVRMIQLTYNHQNLVGYGCMDPEDDGLSRFGRDLVAEMDRLGVVIDLSHTGRRTTLEAIDASRHPTVFSHSNVKRLFDHPRNIDDEQIRAVANRGGLVGVNAVSSFLRTNGIGAKLEDLLDHIDYLVQMIGPEQVCLGLDFWTNDTPDFSAWTKTGLWTTDDIHDYVAWPQDISGPGHFPRLVEGLIARGYSNENVTAIMGNNWIRLFETVWT